MREVNVTATCFLPLVSVLMPVYSGDRYLSQAIESILNQSFSNFEFIIIDDGSTDNSVAIIESYTDPRIRLIRNEANMGVSVALNKGLDLARGTYVARMDSDDISLPERLARQVVFLEAHPEIGICGSWVEILGEPAGQIVRYPTDSNTVSCTHLFGPALAHPSVMMRQELLKKLSPVYDPTFNRAQDFELWVRAEEQTSLANIGEVLLRYRLHQQQVGQFHYEEQQFFAGKVRLAQLCKLGISPSADEFNLHQSISQWRFEEDREFVDQAEKWLCRLLAANREAKVYPESILTPVLGERWYELCDALTGLGPWILKKKLLSPLSHKAKFPWERRVRFFLNSMLGRRG